MNLAAKMTLPALALAFTAIPAFADDAAAPGKDTVRVFINGEECMKSEDCTLVPGKSHVEIRGGKTFIVSDYRIKQCEGSKQETLSPDPKCGDACLSVSGSGSITLNLDESMKGGDEANGSGTYTITDSEGETKSGAFVVKNGKVVKVLSNDEKMAEGKKVVNVARKINMKKKMREACTCPKCGHFDELRFTELVRTPHSIKTMTDGKDIYLVETPSFSGTEVHIASVTKLDGATIEKKVRPDNTKENTKKCGEKKCGEKKCGEKKALKARIDAQAREIDALHAQIEALRAQIDALEAQNAAGK